MAEHEHRWTLRKMNGWLCEDCREFKSDPNRQVAISGAALPSTEEGE